MRKNLGTCIFLLLACLMPMVNAQTKETNSVIGEVVSHPALSELDLFRNIKRALDSHLLVERDFCSEDNLRYIFGANRASCLIDSKWIYGSIDSFIFGGDPIVLGELSLPPISMYYHLPLKGNGNVEARLDIIYRRKAAVSYAHFLEIFGGGWENSTVPQSPHQIFESPRKPNGNAHIEYHQEKNGSSYVIDVAFDADAVVQYVNFTEIKQ
ncbi:hypothetical protein ACO0LO_18725 [Undibacterium sp. TJN25]|uniref:hypothetical protein n=1 Tax=Undibacterium sp. TJN25 TaxID=3413056 RepID=UPI003BEF747F